MKIEYINKRPTYAKAVVSVVDHVECRCQPAPRPTVLKKKSSHRLHSHPHRNQTLGPGPAQGQVRLLLCVFSVIRRKGLTLITRVQNRLISFTALLSNLLTPQGIDKQHLVLAWGPFCCFRIWRVVLDWVCFQQIRSNPINQSNAYPGSRRVR